MAKEVNVTAKGRDVVGSEHARRLRRSGWLPGILNTEGAGTLPIMLNMHDFELTLHQHASESLIMDMAIDGGKAKKVLLKEVQHDPVSGGLLHVDFVEVSMTRKLRVSIPIVLQGEPVGVVQDGGVLDQPLRSVEVECFPGDLVESIPVDVSGLSIGDTIQVRDLVIDATLHVLTPGEITLASVAAPRLEEEVAPAEPAEGEVPAEGEAPAEGEEGKAPKAAAGETVQGGEAESKGRESKGRESKGRDGKGKS
ncbi:MAG: 50S ribosomal protein L25 [Kiritimatiellae bacterium]|nr:50S ribosomal protein L25 [Kiritimatiellia bacterium]